MTVKPTQKDRDANVVGQALAEVLPQTDKWWFQQPHLLKLNLLLAIPVLSSSVSGFDGLYQILMNTRLVDWLI